jgi:CDP-diglyceride synthetase
MKWLYVLGLIAVVVLMTLYEWPRIKGKREKMAYSVLTLIGLQLSILFLLFPDIPGPAKLIDTIYRPLGRLLEK